MEEKMKILVVVDAQIDFITGALRNEEAIKTVPNIVERIDNFDGDVIFYTVDTHHTDYLETKEGEKLPVPHCIQYTEGWNIEPNVARAITRAASRGIMVRKVQKPTFGSIELPIKIKSITMDKKMDIEILGFCTDICVVSNALVLKTLFFDKADITVNSKCCAGVTPESHEAALTTMKMCQIDIV